MNLELLNQFGQPFPEDFDIELPQVCHATVAAFNRRGYVLAVGSNDGRVFIWDIMTRTIAKVISAHGSIVTALSWSRNGKLLATSSTDCYVCIWDVITSECIIQWHFTSAVLFVQFAPRDDTILLIRRIKESSLLVRYARTKDKTVHTKEHTRVPPDEDSDFDVVSCFDRRGEYIYSGNSKGRIQVMKVKPGTIEVLVLTSFRVSNTAIKQIEFAPKKKNLFLVNSADRIIRVYDTNQILAAVQANAANASNVSQNRSRKVQSNSGSTVDLRIPDPEPCQKLQDLINRTTWRKCVFSGSPESDYICAGSSRSNSIYIWELTSGTGTLMKLLRGSRGEIINDVVWHPIRAFVASIASGYVSLWSAAQVENWSAFAPDFQELEENVEYEERESEFDDEDEDKEPKKVDPDAKMVDDVCVDVVTPVTVDAYLSSDEEEENPDDLIYFPNFMNVDEDEVVLDSVEDESKSGHKEKIIKDKNKSDPEGIKALQTRNRNAPTLEL
ncbi:PREDICTED: retinoblastoma-binding protein 5 homolog [Rhagoletis zephyria]|uniref:retinoblastoma-binding protein 5 homolog n=1 Tax=Rhagoletis zephyria TaxID=28612 RepID=UPI000811594C|nr:PREDICTED: retinoblastoma-binding protein 5 homolog [Rhagoletis zephyria]KAH9409645.1 Retinoblastoma-binding protein 5 [Tyrophagus putrescentiae]